MNKLISYFRKSIDISIDYITKNGVQMPDSFNISIRHKNKTSVLTYIDWKEMDNVLKKLEKEDKITYITRTFGNEKEVLSVPGWARKKLLKTLRNLKRVELERVRDEMNVPVIPFSQFSRELNHMDTITQSSFLISGIAGTGKSHTIKQFIPTYLNAGQRVCLIDFRDDYKDIFEEYQGISLKSDEMNDIEIEGNLVRIYYGCDIFYKKEAYKLPDLSRLAKAFDVLIIDDATALYLNHKRSDIPEAAHLASICSSLIELNPKLNIVFSTQSLQSLADQDNIDLPKLFSHQLLFKQYHIPDNIYANTLYALEQGEAVFFIQDEAQHLIQFKS